MEWSVAVSAARVIETLCDEGILTGVIARHRRTIMSKVGGRKERI